MNKAKDLYDRLEVDKDADYAEIKKAYRKKAKQTHQDKGGDPAAFQNVHAAYMVLKDPKRRRKYDETGAMDLDPDDPRGRALGICTQTFLQIFREFDPDRGSPLDSCVVRLRGEIAGMKAELEKIADSVKKTEKLRKRLTRKTGPDFLGELLNQGIRSMADRKAQLEEAIKDNEAAIELFENYEYETPRQEPLHDPMSYTTAGPFGDLTWNWGPR